MMSLVNKKILMIVGGGISAYKSLECVRLLKDQGARVSCVLTKAGAQFVTPLSLATLSKEKVFENLFSLTDETEIGHIELARGADVVVVAPATANLMAKMTHGIADDLATTILLATKAPVILCPAMNPAMWSNRATQRNITQLQQDAFIFIGPEEGITACGEEGLGRMASPQAIVEVVANIRSLAHEAPLVPHGPLAGKKALVTSGPTHEEIDPVRYLSNCSSGKQGTAIAEALHRAGARTTLITGPTALPPPTGVKVHTINNAREMDKACQKILPVDIAVFAAAVTDWRPVKKNAHKIKKNGTNSPTTMQLTANPDILARVAQRKKGRPHLVIGFAAETENVIANARRKRQEKGCDWIVANAVNPNSSVFGSDDNTVHLITSTQCQNWKPMSKKAVAEKLVKKICHHYGATS